MSEAHNIKLVQDSFAAFSKGDIAALLELLSDDVVWHGVYGGSADVPQAGERRGRVAPASRGGAGGAGALRRFYFFRAVDNKNPFFLGVGSRSSSSPRATPSSR